MRGPALRGASRISVPVFINVDLELFDQSAQFSGGFHQLLGRLLRVIGSARGALGCLRYSADVAGDLAAALGCFAHVA